MAEIDRLVVSLQADIAGLKRGLGQAEAAARKAGDKMGRSLDAADRSSQQLTRGLGSLRTAFGAIGVGVSVAVLVAGFKSALQASREFADGLSELSAITGAVGKDLEFLAEQADEIGRTTTKSAGEALSAFKLIASAKPELLENGAALAAITKEAVTLAEATGLTLPEAARALVTSLNQFGAGADQASRFINVLAAGAQKGAAEVPELAQALIKAGTVANQAGVSFEEFNALLQRLASFKTPIETIGTSTRNIFLILQKGADETNPAVVGLTKALENLGKKNLSVAQLTKLFGQENVVVAQQMIQVADSAADLTKEITGTSTAYEQASTRTNNLSGDLARLGNALFALKKALVDSEGAMRDVTQTLTSTINSLVENIDNVQTAIAAIGAGGAAAIFVSLARSVGQARVAVLGLNLALLANPAFAAFAAVGLLTAAIITFSREEKTLTEQVGDYNTLQERANTLMAEAKDLTGDLATKTREQAEALREQARAIVDVQLAQLAGLRSGGGALSPDDRADQIVALETSLRDIGRSTSDSRVLESIRQFGGVLRELGQAVDAVEALRLERLRGLVPRRKPEPPPSKTDGDGAGGTDADREKAIIQVNAFIAALEREAILLNVEDSARAKVAATMRIEEIARAANIALTDEQRESLNLFVDSIEASEKANRQAAEAQNKFNQQLSDARAVMESVRSPTERLIAEKERLTSLLPALIQLTGDEAEANLTLAAALDKAEKQSLGLDDSFNSLASQTDSLSSAVTDCTSPSDAACAIYGLALERLFACHS